MKSKIYLQYNKWLVCLCFRLSLHLTLMVLTLNPLTASPLSQPRIQETTVAVACQGELWVEHDLQLYRGLYTNSGQIINAQPVFVHVNMTVPEASGFRTIYLYAHQVTASGFVWVMQPVAPDPTTWKANAYSDGETPWSSSWSRPTVKVECRVNPNGNQNSSYWKLNGSDIFYNDGKVGIGTNTPAQELDINGNVAVKGKTIIDNLGNWLGNPIPGSNGKDGTAWFSGSAPPDPNLGVERDFFFNKETSNIYQKTNDGWQVVVNIQGKNGADGATWFGGSTAPDPNLGVERDFFFNKKTSNIYQKTNDGWQVVVNIQGKNGADGITWFGGSTAPDPNLGVERDFFFNKETSNIYQKTNDGWQVVVNIQGKNGADGITWFGGSTAPDPNLGVERDFFLNKETSNIYQKTNDGWQVVVNIQGKNGADGITWFGGSTAPDPNLGVERDFFFNKETSEIYQKTNDGWQVVVNIQGKNGADGITWFGGSTAPDPNLGVERDFFFNKETSEIYQKTNNGWQVVVNIQGKNGADGATWLSGGPRPVSTQGADGDFYFSKVKGDIYQKTNGEWQPVINIKGEKGAAGKAWLSGNSAPTASQGANGDFFLNTTTDDVFQKANKVWQKVTTIRGATGAIGADGATWLSGRRRPVPTQGTDGDFFFNNATSDIFQKTNGEWQPVVNIKGKEGAAGTAWLSGNSAPTASQGTNGDFFLNTATDDVFQKTNNVWQKITNIKGTKGLAGADGATWLSGSSAPTASQGANGDFFLNTTTDDVFQKANNVWQKVTTIRGATGAMGADGATWLSGRRRPVSTQGTDGDFFFNNATSDIFQKTNGEWQPVVNIKGKEGAAGTAWLSGNSAPTASQGTNGDFFLNTATDDVFQKTNNVWQKITNIKGTKGLAGADGATWLSGSSAPTASQGANGDFFLNTATDDVFQKANDTWQKATTIKGATGAKGIDGTVWISGTSAPASATGTNGDFFFNKSTDDIYQKANGNWQLITNIKGIRGDNGNFWWTGNAAPANNIGATNDLYFDTASSNVYKKQGGQWQIIANLRGRQGATGAEGGCALCTLPAAASAAAAGVSAGLAAASATAAAGSAGAAGVSAGAAAASVAAAGVSATAAAASATEATGAAGEATTAAGEASTASGEATTSATEASTSASEASTSATEASTSAEEASTSATEAGESATKASDSATEASNSASEADQSAKRAENAMKGPAGGDLSGNFPNPMVVKLQGQAISNTQPTDGQTLQWNNTDSKWQPETIEPSPWKIVDGTNNTKNLYSRLNAVVAIGTVKPNESFMLTVDGEIMAKGLTVQEDWSDYVFEEDYTLMPIADLAAFIKKNRHLPGVPTEKKVVEKGLNIGETQKIMMAKIEELTLYLIELKKDNDLLKKQISALIQKGKKE